MNILKIIVLLLCMVIPRVALVEKGLFKKDNTIVNIVCPSASLDLGLFKTVIGCASMCDTITTCRSFFYNKIDRFCKGASSILSTTDGCEVVPGTAYYQTTDVTTTTSTTTTTTTTSTVLLSQFGNPCTTNADCTMHAGMCLQLTCSCQAGYRYDPTSGSCVTNCVSYGSTYIEYLNLELSVFYTAQYIGITLMQCQAHCTSSSSCKGFNYSPVFADGMCRLKSETDPSAFLSLTHVNYYTRNCA